MLILLHRVIAVSKTYNQFKIIRSIYEPTLLYGSASRFQPVEQFLQTEGRRNTKAARGQVFLLLIDSRFSISADSNSMSVHRPSGDNFRWRGRTQSSFIRMAVASQIKVGGSLAGTLFC